MIESMIVVALIAILGMLATGSMGGMLGRGRLEGSLSAFVGDLKYARSEAVTRGHPVSVCPSADGITCVEDDAWHRGWIVFSDPAADGHPSSPQSLLRRQKGWSNTGTFVATPGTGAITYGRDGFLLRLESSEAVLRAQAPSGPVRCVSINRAGRQVVQQMGEGGCA